VLQLVHAGLRRVPVEHERHDSGHRECHAVAKGAASRDDSTDGGGGVSGTSTLRATGGAVTDTLEVGRVLASAASTASDPRVAAKETAARPRVP
jgi:hypothetical protein